MNSKSKVWIAAAAVAFFIVANIIINTANSSEAEKRAEFEKIRRSAEAGSVEDQLELGFCYFHGNKGVAMDQAEAAKWFRKAAEAGEPAAQMQLGSCYERGTGLAKDQTESAKWYRAAASKASAFLSTKTNEEFLRYGRNKYYFFNLFTWIEKSAKTGDPAAQFQMGEIYSERYSNNKDADEWYKRAAEHGYAPAQAELGKRLFEGNGVAKNGSEAAGWLKKAAEQGNADGHYGLGNCYRFGVGVEKDTEKAVYWLSKAADAGIPRAQSDLGLFYLYGEGVAKDQSKAAALFRKAALKEDAAAQFNIGQCYFHGEGVPKDDTEAARWWRKASEQGDPAAQIELGDLYSKGQGVAKDEIEAYSLYNIAGIKLEDARARLTQLEKRLSRDEVAAGQKRTMELQKELEAKIAANKAKGKRRTGE